MKHSTLNIQGNLISEEILHRIETGSGAGQLATDFGLEPGSNVRSEIEYAWSRIKLDWKHFSGRSQNLSTTDPYGTTLSRKWMEQFLSSIGFELIRQRSSLVGDNNKSYSISHTADNLDHLPIHLVGFLEPSHPEKNTLDIKTSGGNSRFSPHGTMQEYLNVTDHVYGIVTNGFFLRLIRDSGRLIKLSYVEFDLKRLLDEDKYSEFSLLYRLLHASRFSQNRTDIAQSLLETYFKDSIETGNRIRDGLSKAVKSSLLALGNGFLQQEHNTVLREKILTGVLSHKNYYRQLLRVIYRLLFLMVTEERDLVYDPEDKTETTKRLKNIYLQFYSIARLRKLSSNRYVFEDQFNDLWQSLLNTFFLFESGGNGQKVGVQPLDGDLFGHHAIVDLQDCLISNRLLLECIRNMNEFRDANDNLVAINYRSLDVEELGSVYEGLLELHPLIKNIEATNSLYISFTFHEGTDRKTTGSYYTHPDLVNELIKSALIPVIEERLKNNIGDKTAKSKALLQLRVCDAAAGSGHMLLAAARTIAWYLAKVQSGEENPSPNIYRICLREVIQHCIYAVDYNPDAVELCKLALWLEGHNSGKPLTFLDHKIRNGNSLVGVTDLSVLHNGIPDNAFNPVTSDDKKVCKDLKRENNRYNKTKQTTLDFNISVNVDTTSFIADYKELENLKQDDITEVNQIKNKFERFRTNQTWFKDWRACNLWTAAFFWNYIEGERQEAPNSEHLSKLLSNPSTANSSMIDKADALSLEYKFFHWPLEFPDVFENGGFDVMLGNPPWEKLQAEEEEFFKVKDDEIANHRDAERRKLKIEELKENNSLLYDEWMHFKNSIHKISKFIIHSNRFNYSANGNLNLYKVFVELVRSHLKKDGTGGMVIQSGLFTDELSKQLFEDLIIKKNIVSVYDFDNTKKLFDIDSRISYSLLTITKDKNPKKAFFKFGLKSPEQINLSDNGIFLSYDDIKLINPNTFLCPQISTAYVFELLKKLYIGKQVISGLTPESSFGVRFWGEMFNMTRAKKYLHNTLDILDTKVSPLYEAKYFHQFDHRYATFKDRSIDECINGKSIHMTAQDKLLDELPVFRYYVKSDEIKIKCEKYNLKRDWLLTIRSIARSTDERTIIASIIPKFGVGNSANIACLNEAIKAAHLLASLNSLVLDFIARNKVGNVNFNIYIIEQLPILTFHPNVQTSGIIEKVLELTYTSWNIKAFADDIWREADDELKAKINQQWADNQESTQGNKSLSHESYESNLEKCPLPPFKWNENRRAVLKAELDAIYAKLYGLSTEEISYILDPQDVRGLNFSGETFRVLREKEIRIYGEYRTKRLVLEAWRKLNQKTNDLPIDFDYSMIDLSLHTGIYSIAETTSITRFSSQKVTSWFKALAEEGYEGLDAKRASDINKSRISFHGLIELVVIGTLRENGFSLKKILKARADLAEKGKGKYYPFATNNVAKCLKISGSDIVWEFSDGLKITLDGTGQINIDFIELFFRDIIFSNDVAQRLMPVKGNNKVIIDPKIGLGKPVILDKEVPVDMIASRYMNGNNAVTILKREYDLSDEEIMAAVAYMQ